MCESIDRQRNIFAPPSAGGDNPQMRHIGSLDVDLSLDPVALSDGEYAMLIDELKKHGYAQSGELKKFQMVRTIQPEDGGPAIAIIVDFLMPRDAVVEQHIPLLVDNLAVQKADGAALALKFSGDLRIGSVMPEGGKNVLTLRTASIPAMLAMKGFALGGRKKDKDAHDIYYCVRNYEGGVEGLIVDCLPGFPNSTCAWSTASSNPCTGRTATPQLKHETSRAN